MPKIYKAKEEYKMPKDGGLVPLENGYALLVPRKGNTKDLMVACGALISMLACVDKENGLNKETFKKMIDGYIDCIYDGKLPDGIFIKKGKKE
jgi:hypothetical protein